MGNGSFDSSCPWHSAPPHLIFAAGGVGFEDLFYLVADAAEDGELFFLSSRGVGGVVKREVVATDLTREDRAGLIRIAADCDDGLDGAREKFVEVLRSMAGDIDADFCHGADGQGVDIASGPGACACYFIAVS